MKSFKSMLASLFGVNHNYLDTDVPKVTITHKQGKSKGGNPSSTFHKDFDNRLRKKRLERLRNNGKKTIL